VDASVDGVHGLHVWETAAGKEIWKKPLPNRMPGDFTFSPDGKLLALILIAESQGVELWDAATGKLLRTLEHPKNTGIARVAFAPDGKTLATATGDRVFLWEVATGKEQARLEGKIGWSVGLAFTPDGKALVSASADTRAHIWDIEKRKLRFSLGRPLDVAGASLALSPDGRTAAVGTHYSKIHFWDVATGKELFSEFQGPDSRIRCLTYSPDGRLLACGGDLRKVHLWDAKIWKPCRELDGIAQSLSFALDGKRLAGVPFVPTNFPPSHWSAESNKPLSVWDLSTGKAITPIPNKGPVKFPVGALAVPDKGPGNIHWATFCRGGKALATFDDERLVIWDAGTWRKLGQVSAEGLQSRVTPLVTPDGRTAVLLGGYLSGRGAPAAVSRVIDLDSGTKGLALPAGGYLGALSPDGKTLALGLQFWDLVLGKEIRREGARFGPDSGPLGVLAWSPDGRWLATAPGFPNPHGNTPEVPRIQLWDVRDRKEVASFQTGGGFVGALAFSPDGSRLASGMRNGSVLVWDVAAAVRAVKPEPGAAKGKEVAALWQELTGQDATRAHQSLWAMVAVPAKTVPFLKAQLLPKATVGPDKIRQWVAELDSPTFSVRDKASRRLRALGAEAEPYLSQALKGKPSLETRRRVEALLQALQPTSAVMLRSRRGIQVLEHIGTPEARQVLQALTAGPPAGIQAREARAALDRLTRRAAASP
jgi:WD40 repeat protein